MRYGGGMRYIVYGPGGIGGALGGHLFRSGREVVLVGRGSHIEKIRRHGLDLITPKESFRLKVPAVDGPGGVDWKEGDVVYLAMKSQDTEGALRDLVATGVAVEDLRIICFSERHRQRIDGQSILSQRLRRDDQRPGDLSRGWGRV